MGYCNGLGDITTEVVLLKQATKKNVSIPTLGGPVVPEDHASSATFVFPSPGLKTRSVKQHDWSKPLVMSSGTVLQGSGVELGWAVLPAKHPGLSNRIMRSSGSPQAWAACNETSRTVEWTIMKVTLAIRS